jgi:hypothetical protein
VFHENNLTQLSNLHPTQFGDWLAIEFPYKTTLRHMKLTPATVWQSFPYAANLYATNNDLTWTEIKYWDGLNPGSASNVQTITVNATEQFKKYALVTTKLVPNTNIASAVSLQDWQLFTESFSIDGGKVAMAQQAATGGETVMDQHGPHGRGVTPLKKYPHSDINVVLGNRSSTEHFSYTHAVPPASSFEYDPISNTYTQAGYTFSASSQYGIVNGAIKGHTIMEAFDNDLNLPGENAHGGYSSAGYILHYASQGTSYSVTADSTGGYPYTEATNNVTDADGNTYTGVELKMGLPKKIKLESVDIYTWLTSGRKPWKGHVFASNTGVNGSWIKIQDFNNLFKQNGENAGLGNQAGLDHDYKNLPVNGTQYYNWYSIVVTHINGNAQLLNLFDLSFNGYEQDQPEGDISVDTTFTSIMNTPQTLGANVYVDGNLGETFTNRVVGPTPEATSATYDSTGKYWTLTGQLTSNVTVESNTFLHADNPHAISMWVNSSNLEANVSNSCIFSYNVGVSGKTLDCIVNHDTTNYHHFYHPEDRVEASDRQANDSLGEFGAVEISADGNFMVIGARKEDDGNTDAGAAYVYKKVGNKWLQEQKLQAGITATPTNNADRGNDDNFGKSVAISGDGKTIAVGAINDDQDATNQGAVYVFVRDDSTESWSEQRKIGPTGTLADTGASRHLGWDVSLSYDGSRLAVGEQYGDTGATNAGSAWVFDRTGTSWSTGQRLDRSDSSGATNTFYGASIAISGNGNYIVVGSHYMTSTQGRAYVWVRDTTNNTWSQQQILSASDATNNTEFGIDVGIDDSGTYIIVGAWLRDEVATNTGNAYIFFRNGSGSNPWTQQAELVNPDPNQDDYFGQRVAISGDGKYVAVGAELDDDGVRGTNLAHEGSSTRANSGSVYTYSRSGTTWTTVNKLRAGDLYGNDRFGGGVSLSGDGKYLATVAYLNYISLDANGVGWVYVLSNERTMHNKPMLELQPNTWHNITYSYEGGEGGSRITYLDGRKVSDDRIHDSTRLFPPFEMTNWEQGGYKVTCSGVQHATSGAAYQVFQRSYYWYTEPGSNDPGSSYLDQNARPLSKGGDPSTAVTDTVGTTHVGQWVQLEFPSKIYVDWLWLKGGDPAANYYTHNPDNYVILGSNDNVNFDLLATRTNASNGTSGMTLGESELSGALNADKCVVNAQKAYKYIRFLCTKIGDANGNRELILQELRYFGHFEGDESEFPDPNTVRTYPPPGRFRNDIHFRSNTSGYHKDCNRGYEVSASSKYTASSNTDAWRAFQGYLDNTAGGGSWDSADGSYASSGTGRASTGTTTFNSRNGEWINVKFPYKVKLVGYQHWTRMNRDYEGPYSGYLYGSNDGFNTFQEIQRFSAITLPSTTRGVTYRHDISASYTPDGGSAVALIPYNEYRLQVTHTVGADYVNLTQLEFYGTADESISVPIQLGGGNIDKIANFRIYDKSLTEDQVMEVWDFQKDQFERSKTSMTLHKGRLGIGTSEPIGRLSVLDENYELEKFPPRPMIRGGTYMDGHGVFVTRASSEFNTYTMASWRVHAGITSDVNSRWRSASGVYTNNGPGGCIPSSTGAILTGTRVKGEYVITEMPYKICLKRYEHEGFTSQSPKEGQIWGSNDGLSWSHLHTFTNGGVPIEDHRLMGNQPKIINYVHDNTKYYSKYAFISTMINGTGDNGDDALSICDISYFGIRERGQSTLDDGNLSITKKLDVSTIGPISDKVKELTPHRDDLICEYITSTNPFRNKSIIDTSGKGNDGIQHLGSYQPEWKSISLGGSSTTYDSGPAARIGTNASTDSLNDYGSFETVLPQLSGNPKMTVSWWMRIQDKPPTSDINMTWLLGRNDRLKAQPGMGNHMHWFGIQTFSNGETKPRVAIGGGGNLNMYYNASDIIPHLWYHCCLVINPTHGNSGVGADDVTLYMTRENDENPYGHIAGREKDGTSNSSKSAVRPCPASSSGSSGVIDLGDTYSHPRMHWGWQEKPDVYGIGSLAQPKVWNRALTRHEVQSVYELGRHDQGLSVVNFSKTAVGVGLGDGVIPRGLLDVRGDTSIHGRLYMKGGESEIIWDASTDGKWKIISDGGGTGTLRWYHYHYRGGTIAARNWDQQGYMSWNVNNRLQNFTGQHRTFIKDVPFSQAGDLEGLVVSSDQNKYIKMSGGIEAGSNAITTNESLPIVSLSNVLADKKCFGVISSAEDPDIREQAAGKFVSVFEKEKGDTRVYINSVGEGAIWVVNTNGSLEAGDYITTSNVTGYGQKQDDDILHNYSVAKITMDCDFNPATQPVQQILRSNVTYTYYLANIHHIKPALSELLTTIVTGDDEWSDVSIYPSDVTYAEWSNLEVNTQNTYTLTYTQTSNVVYDTKYTLTTTANVTESDAWDRVSIDPPTVTYAEYSNLEANTQSSYSLTFTKTTTDEKTPEEWSALESNTQSLYNEVYYQSVEEEVASDYPGATTHTRVTDVIENELDAHGQIQWEDHATETEKAYKIRYLDVSGAQTDSANAVHIAAFVGCTYHCG